MSTKEKRFDAAIQIKEDLLLAVRNMTGVIPVTKKIFELELQLENLEKETQKLKEENNILRKAKNLIDDEELKDELYKKIILEKSILISSNYDEIKKIKEEISELNREYSEYVDYSEEIRCGFEKMGRKFLSNRVVLSIDKLTNDEMIAYYFIKLERPKDASLEKENNPVRKRILQVCIDDNGEFDKFEEWLKNGMQ